MILQLSVRVDHAAHEPISIETEEVPVLQNAVLEDGDTERDLVDVAGEELCVFPRDLHRLADVLVLRLP